MGVTLTKLASEIWRAYKTDGVSSSGQQKPVKADVRTWGAEMEAAVATAPLFLTSVAGTNTITATSSPVATAYSTGQGYYLVPANTITGAATLNVATLGAKTIVRPDGTAVGAGELIASRLYHVIYDGTYMRLTSTPFLSGSATHNFGSLVDAAGESVDVTVTGAALGDFVVAVSVNLDLQEMILTAHVRAANTVEVRLQNESGATVDLASATLAVRVQKA